MAKQNLSEEILSVLKKKSTPTSTHQIALDVGKAWHTTLTRLLRLQIAGKVKGFKAGNMHLWSIK